MDGVSDICTKGGDINFVFTGFSVNGKVGLLKQVSCLESRSGTLELHSTHLRAFSGPMWGALMTIMGVQGAAAMR